MRNILAEQISKMQSMMGIQDELLLEASKLKILTDKEGLDKDQAQLLDELCGGLAVWMLDRVKNYLKVVNGAISIVKDEKQGAELNKFIIDEINNSSYISRYRQTIIGIMDWIRVGLDGNWADLETKNSPEECDRMGHCGRSSYGYLYSLRETKPINAKFKINKSHLTAAIGADGIMYQLKGPKNSKPKEEFHQYILPLFYVLGGGDEEEDYLVQGFGTEYASQQDFKLTDLPDEVIRNLYQNRPELFEGRSMQRKLVDMGIIEKPTINYNITLEIDPDDVGRYVDGDYV